MVLGDEEKLRRIVMNLVSNAIKFTAQGSVTVRLCGTRAAGRRQKVKVRIADTGIGIPRKRSRSCSTPFSRSSRAYREAMEALVWAWRFRASSHKPWVAACGSAVSSVAERLHAACVPPGVPNSSFVQRPEPVAAPERAFRARGKTVLLSGR